MAQVVRAGLAVAWVAGVDMEVVAMVAIAVEGEAARVRRVVAPAVAVGEEG